MLVSFLALLFSVSATVFCPSANDFVVMGPGQLRDGGWTTVGSGGVATKASFNLLGGSVDFDVDFSGTHLGVNANIYTISPQFSGAFSQADYCDGQGPNGKWCTEVDWIESNGNCGGQSTLHTRLGTGNDGCTQWGCENSYTYNGRASFHMTVSYDDQGNWQVIRDGNVINGNNLNPQPQAQDISVLKQQMQSLGEVIYSSQWVGWVPTPGGCSGANGNVAGSSYSISNLVIKGSVVQGPTPNVCSGSTPVKAPVAAPKAPVAAPVATPVKAPVASPVAGSPSLSGITVGSVPTTGSFSVQVDYSAVQSGSVITVDVLDSNGWSWHGTGTATVNAGSGRATVSVTISGTLSGSTLTLKGWIVGPANVGNWQAATGNAVLLHPISIASPSSCSWDNGGSSNNNWYYQIKATPGASVSVSCSGAITHCSKSSWANDVFQCWPPTCPGGVPQCSAARLSGPSSSPSGLPGWGIALIVIGSVAGVLVIIGVVVFVVRRKTAESENI